jgi:hypothetical protein
LKGIKLLGDPGLEFIGKTNHGKLQAYLYKSLDKLWEKKEVNSTWRDINKDAFTQMHPVFLYFIFRTYYEFAYANRNVAIKDLPNNQNVGLNFDHRLKALTSLMLFRIKSKIDSDICCEIGLGDNANMMHKEFGSKFTKRVNTLNPWDRATRISIFDDWNEKFYKSGEDVNLLTFKCVFENVIEMLQDPIVLQSIRPNWIHLCSKYWAASWGLWPDTFTFGDDPTGEDTSTVADEDVFEEDINQIMESRVKIVRDKLDVIVSEIKTLAENHIASDLEKWIAFLNI